MNQPAEPSTRQKPAVTLRSVALGLAVVLIVSAITPFNDYVANNTPIIGSALPTGVMLLLLLFIVCVNAPLRRWAPRWAVTPRELGVSLAMALVACAVPAGGLMRYLVGEVTGIHVLAVEDERYRELFRELNLPSWLFPTFTTSLENRGTDPVLRDYIGRIPLQNPTLRQYVSAVPWRAWVTPFVSWGIFYALLVGALLAMAVICRRQWVENERLPFPLATIYLSLLEPPEPGRALNATLSSRMFWIAAGIVFLAHGFAGLHAYLPRYVPELVLGFDLKNVLLDGAWKYVEDDFKKVKIVFAVVGVTYFLNQRMAFSLWSFYVLLQFARIGYGQYELEFSADMQRDELFGALLPYTAVMTYVARGHLATVGRLMVGRRRPGDPSPRYLPDGVAGWLFVGCSVGMVVWLCLAGMSLLPATCVVVLMLVFFLVVSRLVAETGMPYVGLYLPLSLPFTYLATVLPSAWTTKIADRNFFLGQLMYGLFAHDHRESLPPYATHAMRVNDALNTDDTLHPGAWRKTFPILGAMASAIAVAFVVSFVAWLFVEYKYPTTLDKTGGASMVNLWGGYLQPKYFVYEPTLTYRQTTADSPQAYWRGGHLAFGAATMTLLSVLRLRYEAFPLHPAGFLMVFTLGLKWVWFSVFLGWLAKGVVLKLGGADLFRRATPLFIGLIVGEVCAAAFWLLVALARIQLGLEYTNVQLLPG